MIGLGSMIGAGIFVALAPAAAAPGSGLLIGLAVVAAAAYSNVTSSARLAARYPDSGAPMCMAANGSVRSGVIWPAGGLWSARRLFW